MKYIIHYDVEAEGSGVFLYGGNPAHNRNAGCGHVYDDRQGGGIRW